MDKGNEEFRLNFHEMEVDDRILKAIAKLGWRTPTLIQEKAIPLLISGKNVLIRARTGSGKTAAFSIPVIQKMLNSKQVALKQDTKVLIIAPSKELCSQIHKVVCDLTIKCTREVRSIDISPDIQPKAQKALLIEKPDIVISTPSKILTHLKSGNIQLRDSLEFLVIDEADLIFSFGYENEIKELISYLPKLYQATLASATLSDDVNDLKRLILHNPVTIKLEEPDLAPKDQLVHYHLKAEQVEKATILYAILKLHLIRGKSIIFMNTVDGCYRIKLFLEQFRISSCVLNSELPASVRCQAVSQFNKGFYDIIIASDENALEMPNSLKRKKEKEANNSRKRKRQTDKESGVTRGIDFQRVSNVINFDFPLDVNSYVHRAGRTARCENEGNVLSFVNRKEQGRMDKVEEHLQKSYGETEVMKAYQFKIEEIESFRYRARDAWRAVTKIAIREARLKEIKEEMLNSRKLKSYFEDNPTDLEVLRHDKALHTVRHQAHLAHVPEYIIPESLQNVVSVATEEKPKPKQRFVRKSKAYKKRKMNLKDPLSVDNYMGSKKRKMPHAKKNKKPKVT